MSRRRVAGPGPGPREHALLLVLTGVLLASVAIPPFHAAGVRFCLVHLLLGIAGPGCGMTRAFLFIGHGDVAAALALNPNSLLAFGLVVLLWLNGLLRLGLGWDVALSLTARQRRLVYLGASLITAAGWLYNLVWNPWL